MKNGITKRFGFKQREHVNGSGRKESEVPAGKLPDYLERPIRKLIDKMQRNPRKTAWAMFLIVLLNFLVFQSFFFLSSKKKNMNDVGLVSAYDSVKGVILQEDAGKKVPFTLSNYFKVKAIKDSMDILMKKKDSLTLEDKKQFINLMERFKTLEK